MRVTEHKLSGVKIIEPKIFADERGFFLENFRAERYHDIGINQPFIQDSISRSKQGTLRGLHYQLKHPQAKLLTVLRGEVFDVFADIRKGSPTFGKWGSVILSDTNHHQLYIPAGFAHGFYALSEFVDFYYKCTNCYHPEDEFGIAWDDPNIAIEWPKLDTPILLSPKDKKNPRLSEIPIEFLPSI
ncbi:MAG: dTDP-4-dehydrorhamnose 3,5-epimerase [uncultured bacterium]|nr:MAG: dTDP-4-dehydrorhamnose 3,5-epimerase [uncultured bacterium]